MAKDRMMDSKVDALSDGGLAPALARVRAATGGAGS
jgi:hypothetical protein